MFSARKTDWDALIRTLTLIHIGQHLGTTSQAARTLHDLIELLLSILR